MSEYKGIKGFQVQTRDEDPSEGIVGDFYYNSLLGQFKTVNAGVGSWSSGGNLNTARKDLGSFGNGATNGIAVGGYGGSGASAGNYVESYNGSSWTETTEITSLAVFKSFTSVQEEPFHDSLLATLADPL